MFVGVSSSFLQRQALTRSQDPLAATLYLVGLGSLSLPTPEWPAEHEDHKSHLALRRPDPGEGELEMTFPNRGSASSNGPVCVSPDSVRESSPGTSAAQAASMASKLASPPSLWSPDPLL